MGIIDKTDKKWLAVPDEETWASFVDRMRQAPHIQKAIELARTYQPAEGLAAELQHYILLRTQVDTTITDTHHLPRAVALLGFVQANRENVATNLVYLLDISRKLKSAWKECEAWLMLHPFMNGKKDGDRKRAVYLILQEVDDVLTDIEYLSKASETAIWSLKAAADAYTEQKQGVTTMLYAGMNTGGNPEHLER